MGTFTRSNAWNDGGTFENQDLYWYAKGVKAMQERGLSDPSSWWFFAAMHAQYVDEPAFPGWAAIPAPPSVPVTARPASAVVERYWDQCQHQSWFFLPWHRGYLLAVEAHLRAAIVASGGPSTWALPYWDYLGPDAQFNIPPAFAAETLDGERNPLFVNARYGLLGDRTIAIPTAAFVSKHPELSIPPTAVVTDGCLSNDVFTGSSPATLLPGFGGPETGFWPGGGNNSSGNIEDNPHNFVHGWVGGQSPDPDPNNQAMGLMADPGTAALDPIFYLHHANIDRLWAVWNGRFENSTELNWLDGPALAGDRRFVMPMPGNVEWQYSPRDVVPLARLNYTYQELPLLPAPPNQLAARLRRLGVSAEIEGSAQMTTRGRNTELVGANAGRLALTGAGTTTTVRLDATVQAKVARSLTAAAPDRQPDRVYLQLESVQGTRDATMLSVYVNLPEDARPADHTELLAGSVGLFGLRRASLANGPHAGQGLTFLIDVTNVIDTLFLRNAMTADTLKVTIIPLQALPAQAEITVGRVSLYREGV